MLLKCLCRPYSHIPLLIVTGDSLSSEKKKTLLEVIKKHKLNQLLLFLCYSATQDKEAQIKDCKREAGNRQTESDEIKVFKEPYLGALSTAGPHL